MNSEWLQHTVLRCASFLTPGDQRAEWISEWQSELWYVPRDGATRFCLGAFQDAIWLRRNHPDPGKRTGSHLESSLSCLAFLAALAAASMLMAVLLPVPRKPAPFWHLGLCDLAAGCIVMLPLSCLLLLATRFAIGQAPAHRPPMTWPNRLRRTVFLVLKIALLQPVLLGGVSILVRSGAEPLVPLGLCVSWILVFRWVLRDQQHRCPVCLRLLTNPVCIGTPSVTFLE